MLTAIDENGQVVNLLEIEVKELTGKYFCPSCKSELFIKNATKQSDAVKSEQMPGAAEGARLR